MKKDTSYWRNKRIKSFLFFLELCESWGKKIYYPHSIVRHELELGLVEYMIMHQIIILKVDGGITTLVRNKNYVS